MALIFRKNKTVEELAGLIQDQKKQLREIQNGIFDRFVNPINFAHAISSLFDSGSNEKPWNPLSGYEMVTESVANMYDMVFAYQGYSIGTLVEARAAITGGNGLEITSDLPGSEREIAFAREYLSFNKFGPGGFRKILSVIELEQQALISHSLINDYYWTWVDSEGKPHQETGMIKSKHIPWLRNRYKIKKKNSGTSDYTVHLQKPFLSLPKSDREFSYMNYLDSACDSDFPVNAWGRAAPHVISIEKAFSDMRTNNNLYSNPKAIIECETKSQADSAVDLISAQNKSKGLNTSGKSALVVTGSFKYAVPPKHAENLIHEINESRSALSFHTGIPFQFFGNPTAIKNKNVTEATEVGSISSTSQNRLLVAELFTDCLHKAMALVSKVSYPYNSKAVKFEIGSMTATEWKRLVDFWLEARQGGNISLSTFLQKVPGIDAEAEANRINEEKENFVNEQESLMI